MLPLEVLRGNYKLGEDVTRELNITQYEPTMDKEPTISSKKKYPKWLMRYSWFRKLVTPKKGNTAFPSFVSKTDEERIQNCPTIVQLDTTWTATEKVDGQSGTFAVVKHKKFFRTTYEFIVCSRNLRKPKPDGTSYWQVAERYDIKNKLIQYVKATGVDWVAIQGECVASNVQGNKYKVREADLYVFNLIDSTEKRYPSIAAKGVLEKYGFKFVPIIDTNLDLSKKTVNDLLTMANGKSLLVDGLREGIVFRSKDGKHSFKAVSPEFLIKYGE